MTTIFVTNNGQQTFVDSFDGTKYTFEPKKELEVPEVVAKHIFGYGDDNKEPYLVRLGWMRMSTDFALAMERLGEFSFAREATNKVHLSAPVVERVAAPMPKARVAAKVAFTTTDEE
jgi:hypothetical protein